MSKEFWKSKTDKHCAEWATLLTNTARSQKIKLFQNPTSNLASRWWQSWWLLSLTRLIDHMVRVGGILSAKGRCCWLGVGNDSMPCRTTYLQKRMNIEVRNGWLYITPTNHPFQNGWSSKNFSSNHPCCLNDYSAAFNYIPQTVATTFVFPSFWSGSFGFWNSRIRAWAWDSFPAYQILCLKCNPLYFSYFLLPF